MRFVWGVRVIFGAVFFAFFIVQYEPQGELVYKKLQLVKVGRSGYSALYIVTREDKYAILYTNEAINRKISRLARGDDIAATIRPGGGIVELSVNGELIYSQSDYIKSRLPDKEIGLRGMLISGVILLVSFIYRRSKK